MRNGLIAAMESFEDALGGDAGEVEQAQTVAEIAEDTVAVNEESESIAEDAAMVEDAAEDTEELVEIGEVAQAAVDSGEGLSEQAAEVATIAIERIHQRLGIRRKNILPACESFGNTNTRMHSTKIVVESITETIRNVWENIKKMAEKIYKKIVDFIKNIFGGVDSLKKRAADLKRNVGSLSGQASGEVESRSVSAAFSIDGKVNINTVETIRKNTQAFIGFSLNLAKLESEALEDLTKVAMKIASDGGVVEADVEKISSSLVSILKNAKNEFSGEIMSGTFGDVKEANGGKIHAFGPFVNNKYLVLREFTGSKLLTIETAGFLSVKKENRAEKCAVLSKSEMEQLLKDSEDLIASFEKTKNVEKLVKTISEGSRKLSDVIIAQSSKIVAGENKEVSKALGVARKMASNAFSAMDVVGRAGPSIIRQTIVAQLDYVDASLRLYK